MPPMSLFISIPKPLKIVRTIGLNGIAETQFVNTVSPRIIRDLKHVQSCVEPITCFAKRQFARFPVFVSGK